jgi:hypothetical protein
MIVTSVYRPCKAIWGVNLMPGFRAIRASAGAASLEPMSVLGSDEQRSLSEGFKVRRLMFSLSCTPSPQGQLTVR